MKLIKKPKQDRFKPHHSSLLSSVPSICIYIGSKEVDYYIISTSFDLIYYYKDGAMYYSVNKFDNPNTSFHKEAIEARNRLKLLK